MNTLFSFLPLRQEKLEPKMEHNIQKATKILVKLIIKQELEESEYSPQDLKFLQNELHGEVFEVLSDFESKIEFEGNVLMVAVFYFSKVCKTCWDISVVNWELYLLVCILLASKMWEDHHRQQFFENYDKSDIARCEIKVLHSLNFELYVGSQELNKFLTSS
jgi:hypothetical protein